jgi:membrane fusion protein
MSGINLFRPNFKDTKNRRLNGNVVIATPFSWKVVSISVSLTTISSVIFLSSLNYSQVETVDGTLVLNTGAIPVIPSRTGVVDELPVKEGDQVPKGRRLVTIKAAQNLPNGADGHKLLTNSIDLQVKHALTQEATASLASKAEIKKLRSKIIGGLASMRSLHSQIEMQNALISYAKDDFEKAEIVAKKGFISKADIDIRRSTLISRQQALLQLQQSIDGVQSDIDQAKNEILAAQQNAIAQSASVLSGGETLIQKRIEADTADGADIKAPASGRITALSTHIGQSVKSDQPLMYIIPDGSFILAELSVSSKAVGLIRNGQVVHLLVDAYPYAVFGSVEAKLVSISQLPVHENSNANDQPKYIATAKIAKPWIDSDDGRHYLKPGMTFSAQIVVRRQRWYQWAFRIKSK